MLTCKCNVAALAGNVRLPPPDRALSGSSLVPDESDLSRTSRPRAWGIPTRRVESDLPVDNLKYKAVKPNETFQAVKDDIPVLTRGNNLYQHPQEKLDTFYESVAAGDKESCLSRYRPGLVFTPVLPIASYITSRFDGYSPSPLEWSASCQPILDTVNAAALPPSSCDIDTWCEQLQEALCVGEADRQKLETEAREQSTSNVWYRERVVRVTASNFGRVVKTKDGKKLAMDMLYVKPPVGLTALQVGREREPQAAAKYVKKKRSDGELVEIAKSGLVVHPTLGVLAASPDRLVLDPSSTPSDGIMEIKVLTKATVSPEEYAKSGKCLYLKVKDGRVQLSRTHNYYYQVQCQLSCTGRSWCGFVVMSYCAPNKLISVERIFQDARMEGWTTKASAFFRNHHARELVYPAL